MLATAILAFISTNIDDIFILMLFYGSRRFGTTTIVLGQYLGIGCLVIFSLVGSCIGNFFDPRYVGLLGLFPVYLAIRGFMGLLNNKEGEEKIDSGTIATGILSISGVTIANGADNIGVYVPLLSTMSSIQKIEMVMVFAVMTYIWCVIGKHLSSRPMVAEQIDRYGHIIMPVVLLVLGGFILYESKAISLVIK
jgi:cadmium resistance protein CadD (predicted permease)